MRKFDSIFKSGKNLIGALHFPPMSGYIDYPGFEYIKNKTIKDVDALISGGIDSIILENNYNLPHKINETEEVEREMNDLAKLVRSKTDLPIGISVLWNDYEKALRIAMACKGQFIRVPVFVDSVETDYGRVMAEPEKVIAIREQIGAHEIAVFTDIQVKHSKMLDEGKDLLSSAKEAIEKGSDGLIITGKWTGDCPLIDDIKRVREGVSDFPILVGSGATDSNIKELFEYVDAVIVGTFLKTGSYFNKEEEINIKKFEEMIDPEKVSLLKKSMS